MSEATESPRVPAVLLDTGTRLKPGAISFLPFCEPRGSCRSVGCWSLGKGGLVFLEETGPGRAPQPLPAACNPLIANTWASLPLRAPDEGCVHPTPSVLFFVKETGVSYTRVRGQLPQVGSCSICLHFVFLHFLQHSRGRPLKSLSSSLFS